LNGGSVEPVGQFEQRAVIPCLPSKLDRLLAKQLRVSRQTVNAIETGRYDASLPLAFAIAKLFKRRIEEIFFPEPVPAFELRPRVAGKPFELSAASTGRTTRISRDLLSECEAIRGRGRIEPTTRRAG
jgi:putative transcriptional regulator